MQNKILITLLAASTLVAGCGGGSNNDQGVSFSLIGFNSVDDQNACEADQFVSENRTNISFGDTTENLASANFTPLAQCMTVRNNMSSQGIRVDRAILNYNVAGSSLQPPRTTVATSKLLGVSESGYETPPDSSLPPGFAGIAPESLIAPIIIPPSIFEYLNLNRNSFPDLPYILETCVTLSGVTTSGQRINTNEACIPVTVAEDNVIPPTEGDGADAAAITDGLLDTTGTDLIN